MDSQDKNHQKVLEIWEKTKDALKKLGHETAVYAEKGAKEVAKATKAGKMKVEILAQKKKRDNIYRQIGQKVWDMVKSEKLSEPSLKVLAKQVDTINEQISELEHKIDDIYKKGSARKKTSEDGHDDADEGEEDKNLTMF